MIWPLGKEMTCMISVSVVEDDADIRESLDYLISTAEGYECIATYEDCFSAIKGVKKNPPQVILMDIGLPGMSGVEGIRLIKEKLPQIDIVVISIYQEDKIVYDSLCAGACGYLTKNATADRILEAIKEAHRGGAPMSASIARMVVESFKAQPNKIPLTKREKDVLTLLCNGESYKMIADNLCISSETVHSHIKKIYKKLEVNSKSEAVAKALREKIVYS